MVAIIVLPSWHAHSYTGPCVLVHGISALQGLAHVVASSTVNWYVIVSSALRAKRSTRCSLSLDPRYALRFVKLVVSTTSVFPSQCPTESPCASPGFGEPL